MVRLVGFAVCIWFCSVQAIFAASVHFELPEQFTIGEVAQVKVFVDPEGEYINAVEGEVVVSGADAVVTDVYNGDSIVSLWAMSPTVKFSGGINRVPFSGGIPGGFKGVFDYYTQTVEPGLLMTLVVLPRSYGTISFTLSDVSLYRHDGKGTEIQSKAVSKSRSVAGQSEKTGGADTTEEDVYPPVIDFVDIVHEPSLFSGEPTLIVDARDDETGIFYIEVKVGEEDAFERIESPYALTDIANGDQVHVRVMDMSGNQTETSIFYQGGTDDHELVESEQGNVHISTVLLLVVSLSAIGILYMVWRPRRV